MGFQFASVLVLSLTAVGFVWISLLAGRFLRPSAPNPDKASIYECGERPIGQAWFNFNPRFYLVALAFVVFEVEIAFLVPVASVYRSFVESGRGFVAFGELVVFVGILAVGLGWVWARGDLEWVKGLQQEIRQALREKAADGPRRAAG